MGHTHTDHTSVFHSPGEGAGASVRSSWPFTPGGRGPKHGAVHHSSWRGLAQHIPGIHLSQVAWHLARTTDSGWLPAAPEPSKAPATPAAIDSGQCLWCSEMDSPSGVACRDLMSRHQTREGCGESWGLEKHPVTQPFSCMMGLIQQL